MADLSTGSAFVAGTTIVASAMNTRFTNVETWAKGTPDLSTSGSMTTVKGTLNVDEAVTLDATLAVTGTATLAGIVDVTNTTDASDATGDTGALRTEGGASIAKKLYVGTGITGDLTGNVTGNCSGTAATVTTAAQPNITSVGTLTGLSINNGSVGAAALKFASNEADSGFYYVSADQIGLSSNGLEAMRSITAGSVASIAIGYGNTWTGSVGSNPEVYRDSTYGTLFITSSKRALKENIQSISDVGSVVDALNPVTFIAAPAEGETEGGKAWRERDLIYGFIAEEVAEIADGKLALYDVDGETLIPSNWKTRDMVALLAAELKSVRQRLAALEA